MKHEKSVPQWLVILAFANIYILWGSTYLAIMYGLEGMPPFILGSFRYLSAGIILLGWCLFKGEKSPGTQHVLKNAGSGIVMLVGGSGLVAWSEQFVSSGQAAIVIATEPFWFLVLDKKNWRMNFSDKFTLTGLVTGFAGIVLFLLWSGSSHEQEQTKFNLLAALVLLGSAVLWVVGSLFSKNNPSPGSTFMNAGIQLFAAGLFSSLIALIVGEWNAFSFVAVPLQAWAGLAFLIIMGSVVAYVSFVWLISVRSPALVSTHTYINPVVAVILGWLFIHEKISLLQVLAMFIILGGVLLINLKNYKRSSKAYVQINDESLA